MSVLAHVVLGGSLPSEPAATKALAFILNSYPDIARASIGLLRVAKVEFEPGRIKAELRHEDGQPDLTIYDSNGDVRSFVENKFWAGLTEAQPVSYLNDLPNDPPSSLVFIVPEQRLSTVWNELKVRCDQAKLDWIDTPSRGPVTWARVGGQTMLITSWKHVLDVLLDAARFGGHEGTSHDILQLQGLTSRMDLEAFLPLRPDEVTDQETALRMMNYSGLIEEITQKLKDRRIADTTSLKTSHGYYTAGRYLRLACGSALNSKYGVMPVSRLCGGISENRNFMALPATLRRSSNISMMCSTMKKIGNYTSPSASRPASNGTGSWPMPSHR